MKDRREFLKMLGLGVVYVSGLEGCRGEAANAPAAVTAARGKAELARPPLKDFYFVQVTDTHWGFKGPPNPEADTTLRRAIAQINALSPAPDFVVFTGDITHTTDDNAVRRDRMREAKQIITELRVKDVRFIPGEHDASPDRGEAFREAFGEMHWSFDHGGVHFVALDNVSDPASSVGDAQKEWLKADLARLAASQPIVVFAHRPLFPLYPAWDWHTKDGEDVIALLTPYENVTVFYGHIHQEHHHVTGRIAHHAARSLIFPLPAPGSAPKRAPLPWDPEAKDHGLGFRQVELAVGALRAKEVPLA
jgi:predicted phosphodiesterase